MVCVILYFSLFPAMMARMRHQFNQVLSRLPSRNITAGDVPEIHLPPFGDIDLDKGNTTSVTKVGTSSTAQVTRRAISNRTIPSVHLNVKIIKVDLDYYFLGIGAIILKIAKTTCFFNSTSYSFLLFRIYSF